ncbi:hypothetical protein LDENG_00149980 [Lucifuga dentata]|nr:hypothetical protein LDENG_00149980 [Lucifuga dentata]
MSEYLSIWYECQNILVFGTNIRISYYLVQMSEYLSIWYECQNILVFGTFSFNDSIIDSTRL